MQSRKIKLRGRLRPLIAAALAAHPAVNSAYAQNAELRLPEIGVTATRAEREVFKTPQAINVITNREVIESNAAATPDILQGEAGILIQKSNTGGGSPFIRGLTGKQVLLLVDGVRVNNSYFRFGPHQYLNTIDPNVIERIEVVRGPSSVLYGSDALGGVINVITKRPGLSARGAATGGLVALRGATADESLAGRAQVEYSGDRLGAIGGVSLKHFGNLDGGGDIGEQEPTAYDEADGDFKLNYRLSGNQEIVFAQQYMRQYDVPKTNEVVLGSAAKFDYEPQIRSLTYLEYHAAKLVNPLFDTVKFNLSYNRLKEGERIIQRATPNIETRELTDVETPGVVAQFNKDIAASHRLTYGVDYYYDRFDTSKTRLNLAAGTATPIAPGTPDGATYDSLGIYLQDEIRLGSRADLIAGVRYSQFEADGAIQDQQLNLSNSKTTGSLLGLYRVTENLNLVGGISQGYRAPNIEDFFGRVDFATEIPNLNLQPETSLNRELGFKYLSGSMFGDVRYFYSTYEDLIARVTVAPGVRQRQNLREATIQGIETSISYALRGGWGIRGALAYTRGRDDVTGNPLQRIPPLNGSAHLRYAPSQETWAELYSLFARKQDRLSPEDLTDPRIPEGGTPGYATINFSVGYRPAANQELIGTVENIADKKYKTHGSGVFAPGINLIVSYLVRF
ncbi:MAG: TonB-dependent receptor plug domain-containing protein [Burkholderiales bacterium]|nr:TonB-dependent receptor [Burkholderiales bacterium]